MRQVLLSIVGATLFLWGAASPLNAQGEPLCRFGVNVSSFTETSFYIDDFAIAPLRAGWYLDYRATPSPAADNGAEYVKVMWTSDDNGLRFGPRGDRLAETVAAHPGGLYVVGNEPDRRELQDDVLPANYAAIYHDAYHAIKAQDPDAHVLPGAIVQPTPLRLRYLDRVLAAYEAQQGRAMPVDGWAIHSFLLNERSCDAYGHNVNICWGAEIPPGIDETDGQVLTPQDNARLDLFIQGIERFRRWMAENGYRHQPLYVTEYGVLMPPVFGFPPSTVNEYMAETFDYMRTARDPALGYLADDNRLVQRFAWFSTLDPDFNGQLYEGPDDEKPLQGPFTLSAMGEHFATYTEDIAATSDLAVMNAYAVAATASAGGSRATPRADLVAQVANQGNRLAETTASVRFYVGPEPTVANQVGAAQTVRLGGCGATEKVSVAWPDAQDGAPRTYQLWVVVEDASFVDADAGDNTLRRTVITNPRTLYLPHLSLPALAER